MSNINADLPVVTEKKNNAKPLIYVSE